MIKNTEYESLGKNVFPIEYLSEEEKKELGILEKKCCKNKIGGCNKRKDCASCTKGCNSLSKDKAESKYGACTNCGCNK